MLICFAASVCLESDAFAADAAASRSTISTGGVSVDPYQSFSTTITLRDANGNGPHDQPTGKVYIWATDESDRVSDGLDVIELSLGSNVYMHQTSRQGVLIMDAAALIQSQRFNLTLDTKGTYELHALYMPTGTIDPNAVTNYWPYELSGNTVSDRTVTVDATPANDVAMMVVSTKIRGIGVVPSLFLSTQPDSVHRHLRRQRLQRYRRAARAPARQRALRRRRRAVYINTTSNNVTVSNVLALTDANGIARFSVSGLLSTGSTLQLRLDPNNAPVVIPLAEYEYKPEHMRFDIGANVIDVDGRTVEIDTAAVVQSGRTYVPYRAIGELLGAEVAYDSHVRTITTTFDDTVLTMTIGYNHYAVNGTVYQMDAAPYINSDGRTMVPIRFVAEVMGYDVQAISGANGLTESVVFTRR